jgi:hypothetical protein
MFYDGAAANGNPALPPAGPPKPCLEVRSERTGSGAQVQLQSLKGGGAHPASPPIVTVTTQTGFAETKIGEERGKLALARTHTFLPVGGNGQYLSPRVVMQLCSLCADGSPGTRVADGVANLIASEQFLIIPETPI